MNNALLKGKVLAVLLIILTHGACASEFSINGFVAQGVVKNQHTNFVSDKDDFVFDLTEIGLNTSYQVTKDLRVSGQVVYLNGGNRFDEGLKLDYLLADWNFYHDENIQSNLYFGRIKNYHWLYSSTRDVPMTRPSIILAQSVYFDGTRDMSVGGDGVAFSHKYSSEILGELDFTISSAKAPISDDDVKNIIGKYARGDLKHEEDMQASLYWQSPLWPWRFGIAVTDADFYYRKDNVDAFFDGALKLKRFYVNTEYFGEQWSFSAELLEENMELSGLIAPMFYRDTTGQGGFVQAEYKFTPRAQLLMRYERYFANKDDKSGNQLQAGSYGLIPYYFGFQHDATLGLTFEFSGNLKLQIEHHWIQGTARLTPLVVPDPIANPQEHWQLTALLLTHWF